MKTPRKVERGRTSGDPPTAKFALRSMVPVRIGLLICVTLLFGPCRAPAQSNDDAEYRVKLAFLYNFAQFIQWPAEAFSDPSAALTICVAGPDPFNKEIAQSLNGRTAGGHPIEIKRLKANDNPKACHMI